MRCRGDIEIGRFDGEALIFVPRTGASYRLNQTALSIFDLATAGLEDVAIVEAVADEYGVAPEEVGREVRGTISRFEDQELIRRNA